MSYQNDPHNRRPATDNTNYTGWIVGGLVALALVVGLYTMFGRNDNKTNAASNKTPATSTTTAPSTTGSGAVTPAPGVPATAPAR